MEIESIRDATEKYMSPRDLVLIGALSALWFVLQLTIGPLGFVLFRLPILCDFAAYFTVLLAVWILGKFGGASLVGIIGSIIVLFLRPGAFQILGFAASAVLFDVLCFSIRHKAFTKLLNVVTVAVITVVSAYFAGAVIGSLFMTDLPYWSLNWALTYWAGLHAVGGLLSVLITFPVIGALEKANVRKLIHRG